MDAMNVEMDALNKNQTWDLVPLPRGKKASNSNHTLFLKRHKVSVVSQFMHSPSEDHMSAVMCILRYLKVTPGKGLMFCKYGYTYVEGYTDADWASSVTDRRSTSRCFTFVGGNLVTWRSKKQKVVSRSNAEAEYRGMAQGVCELLWLRRLLRDLGFRPQKPIDLYCDNKAAITIAHNLVQHDRTKHVEVIDILLKRIAALVPPCHGKGQTVGSALRHGCSLQFRPTATPTSTSTRMALSPHNVSFDTNTTTQKLPILLFDIMDTLVRDHFYHDVPAFFRYPNSNSFLLSFPSNGLPLLLVD
ncbi:unnamed protein product [Prunus armeniaca]